MGVNTRTYKFALGAALLDLAETGRDAVPLVELASTYVGGQQIAHTPSIGAIILGVGRLKRPQAAPLGNRGSANC